MVREVFKIHNNDIMLTRKKMVKGYFEPHFFSTNQCYILEQLHVLQWPTV